MGGRSVIVTGGSTGIGLGVARRFAAGGDRVMITARTAEDLEKAQRDLSSVGGEIITSVMSVSEPDDVQRTVAVAVETFGTIDVLINNAGICIEESVLNTSNSIWDLLIATNLTGLFLMTREVASVMVDSGRGGVIINTSSINSTFVEPLYVPYSATKAAVDAMTKGLAVELAPYGIRVLGVRPGYIETAMGSKVHNGSESRDKYRESVVRLVPAGRWGSPDDLASMYEFLASDQAAYMTGTSVVVDGGRLAR